MTTYGESTVRNSSTHRGALLAHVGTNHRGLRALRAIRSKQQLGRTPLSRQRLRFHDPLVECWPPPLPPLFLHHFTSRNLQTHQTLFLRIVDDPMFWSSCTTNSGRTGRQMVSLFRSNTHPRVCHGLVIISTFETAKAFPQEVLWGTWMDDNRINLRDLYYVSLLFAFFAFAVNQTQNLPGVQSYFQYYAKLSNQQSLGRMGFCSSGVW